MKYLNLELVGFRRMELANISRFSITPTEPIQLILGTNGSGKSSLVSEITPLPGSANDYTPEGSKKVSIEHCGSIYELTSTFAPTTKHRFSKDGLQLNDGGTASVQKELIRQEFGITPDIHSLITGETKFTQMSTPDRRYWFTRLSDTSYDYAINVYNKLTTKGRDVVGSLKLAKKRLVTETSKIIGEDERSNLAEQITDLHKVLQDMLEYRQPIVKTTVQLEQTAAAIERDIIHLSRTLVKTRIAQNGKYTYPDMQSIDKELLNISSDILVYKKLVDKYFEDHTKHEETISILKQKGDNSTEELVVNAESLAVEINNCLGSRKLKFNFTDAAQAANALETVYETLTAVSSAIPSNKNKEFSREKVAALSEKGIMLKNKQRHLNSELSKLSAQKEHQETHKAKDKISCPKCQFAWSQGYSEELYESVCTKVEEAQSLIDDCTTDLVSTEESKEKMNEYIGFFRQYHSCVMNWPVLDPLWNYIVDNKILTDEPRSIQSLLEKLRYDFKLEAQAKDLVNELDKVKGIISLAKQVGDSNIAKLLDEQASLEKEIETTTVKLQESQIAFKKLTAYKKDIESSLELAERIDVLSTTFNFTYGEHKLVLRNSAISDMIRSVQVILAKKEQLLSEINMQQGIIKDIENQIAILELEDSAYKTLIKELSPTEGLIAEGMLGFIFNFTTQMNLFIGRIWAYPLEVVPCGLEPDGSIELDYKFPIKVDHRSNTAMDVRQGSTGMREVIDLAFRITAMKYLGLSDSPAYLDEFGAALDSAHRVNAMQVVKTLVEEQPFTQLFMVSHYEDSYGSLNNAEICVLSNSNIVVPKGAVINKHVRIN